jgi:mRNA interferase RelE/StbE
MFKVAFEKNAEKEFLRLVPQTQKLIAAKIRDLHKGIFANDKALKGKDASTFRKRAGDYRIIYYRENDLLLITVIRVAHRREAY